ncbi:glutamate racemase [Bartonella tamiae]|uniref:Glutamate racemase n=1 Tax=Bartonella tamiae Th239 TaxID=1094558 RepID=J1JUX1_9HYPH|nr:glutamate racemase [Bartonella tamiae]EJF88772.1 glutamate racemase [Bartonella tamiae Th239]EJF94978.1 glutamate racemase [Bartonella tamiae Th307]
MNKRPILFFDSGIGGLTVLREARILMPEKRFVYVADDAHFPYGAWSEENLTKHILSLFHILIEKYSPILCVIACNTASTVVLSELRQTFPSILFVGTVPAIKPAAEQTLSGLITVLATTGTVKRAYTRALIQSFANQCDVQLVGSEKLANCAELYLRGVPLDKKTLKDEIEPCFIHKKNKKTDIIVLACTHFPFLIHSFRKIAPWPVDWIDPAEAIAKRVKSLLMKNERENTLFHHEDLAYFTSHHNDYATIRLLYGFGLKCDWCA